MCVSPSFRMLGQMGNSLFDPTVTFFIDTWINDKNEVKWSVEDKLYFLLWTAVNVG